jgi:hypothetical protein
MHTFYRALFWAQSLFEYCKAASLVGWIIAIITGGLPGDGLALPVWQASAVVCRAAAAITDDGSATLSPVNPAGNWPPTSSSPSLLCVDFAQSSRWRHRRWIAVCGDTSRRVLSNAVGRGLESAMFKPFQPALATHADPVQRFHLFRIWWPSTWQ